MANLIHGDRIGRTGRLRVGCSAVIFDTSREKILLTRRSDNGLWCLPGGAIDPGESAAEACVREVCEETGLHVQVIRLIGVYSNPHVLVEYKDGNRYQLIALSFEAAVTGGELKLSQETTEYGYYTMSEIESLPLLENHRQRIQDAYTGQDQAFVR